MRGYLVTFALLGAAGCTANQATFEHRSELDTNARGVGLLETSDAAQVGMSGNTCEVATATGMIGQDYDVAVGEDDNVVDAMGGSVLVIGQGGVYQVDESYWGPGDALVDISDVVTARFTQTGVVVGTVTNGPKVNWSTEGSSAAVPSDAVLDGMTIDRDTSTVYVPAPSGLVIATPDGVTTPTTVAADMAAWDPTAQAVYVASADGTEVRALEADGTVRWAADVGGPVTSLDDMQGKVAVMVGDSTWGELTVLDGTTGETLSDLATPSAAKQVVVGDGGATMAMVLDRQIHFFGVRLNQP